MNLRTLSALVLLAACGGSDPATPDAAPGADATDPAVDAAPPPGATVFAVGTDFATAGIASTVAVPALEVTQGAVAGVASTDPVVRQFGDRIYVINRYGADNVTILEADTLALVAQISTGSGSNPWDVAVDGDRIYVAALAADGLLILDASRPDDGVVDSIDLTALDPDDDNPNCSALAIAGGRLYVACGILDDTDPWLTPRGPGKVASIDLADDSVDGTVELTHPNPQGRLLVTPADGPLGGDLLIDTVSYADLTAQCLERVTPGAQPTAGGCLVQHADLGGFVSGASWVPSYDALVMAVTQGWDAEDYQPLGQARSYFPAEESLGISPTPSSQRIFDLAICPTDHIVLADAAGGLRVYDFAWSELTTTLLDIGLPPVSGGLTCY